VHSDLKLIKKERWVMNDEFKTDSLKFKKTKSYKKGTMSDE